MTTELPTSPFATLKAIGIIKADHYRRALAHPLRTELAEHGDALPPHLVWLVCRDIMSEEEFTQACRHVAATYSDQELERHNAVLGEALILLNGVRDSFNQQCFDTLLAEQLITPAECDYVRENMLPDNVLALPAAALAWILLANIIGSIRLKEIRATATQGSEQRRAILAEAEGIFANT